MKISSPNFYLIDNKRNNFFIILARYLLIKTSMIKINYEKGVRITLSYIISVKGWSGYLPL